MFAHLALAVMVLVGHGLLVVLLVVQVARAGDGLPDVALLAVEDALALLDGLVQVVGPLQPALCPEGVVVWVAFQRLVVLFLLLLLQLLRVAQIVLQECGYVGHVR